MFYRVIIREDFLFEEELWNETARFESNFQKLLVFSFEPYFSEHEFPSSVQWEIKICL